jgi:hypothetical protein
VTGLYTPLPLNAASTRAAREAAGETAGDRQNAASTGDRQTAGPQPTSRLHELPFLVSGRFALCRAGGRRMEGEVQAVGADSAARPSEF